jgi:hypothetical protein
VFRMRVYSWPVLPFRFVATCNSRKSVATALNVRTSRAALRNRVRAALDRAQDDSSLPARFLWRQSPMLTDARPPRAPILPILGDIAFSAIAERGDAETANGLAVAAIPKDFAVLVRRAGESVNAAFGNRSGRHFAPLEPGSRSAYGKHGKRMVSTISPSLSISGNVAVAKSEYISIFYRRRRRAGNHWK